MPDGSRTHSAERWGEDWEAWSAQMLSDALTYEAICLTNHNFTLVNSDKKTHAEFEPFDLPGRQVAKKKKANPFEKMLEQARKFESAKKSGQE